MARGGVVCNRALSEALASGHLGSAALDITDPEPLPLDHPLRQQPRCTILPVSAVAAAFVKMRCIAACSRIMFCAFLLCAA